MRWRELGWIVFLAGLPLSPFIFRPHLDLWHSQALWAQIWVFILFGLTLGSDCPRRLIANKPLAAWVIWVALSSLFIWATAVVNTKSYPLPMLQGMMHCVIIVLCYIAAINSLTRQVLDKVLRWIAYSGLVVMGYCIIQLLGLDQFLKDLEGQGSINMVGTIGNPSHLGTYLALLVPVFIYQKGWIWKATAALAIALTLRAGSDGATLALFAGLVLLLFFKNWKYGVALLITGLAAGVTIAYLTFDSAHFKFLDPNSRFMAWREFFNLFEQKPVTGMGTGFVMEYSRLNNHSIADKANELLKNWRHVHNEYYQVAIEQGLIGLGIVFWALYDVAKKVYDTHKSGLLITLSTVLLIFCVNNITSYAAHLWLTGSLGLLAYSGIYILAREGS